MSEEMNGVAVMDKPAISESPAAQKVVLPFEKKGEFFVEQVGEIPRKPLYNAVKRVFDIIASLIALIILAIPMGVIAVMIKIKSPGPAFYRQERLGLNGKKIDIIKFRTMNIDAEANCKLSDERITSLNKIGMVWNQNDSKWDNGFKYAASYCKRGGGLPIPQTFITQDGYPLGEWVRSQKRRYRSGRLESDKVRKLAEIGVRLDGNAG